ncbi:MAG TPA: NAD(P)H-hydrate epimerase, partial [Geobacteraceae bacterium]|nr:NAD(P)H-hydrate epimerase [Geobacteraceae bacterium]
MKVVASQTMQELDRKAIELFGVPGGELMERAGRNCAEIIDARYGIEGRMVVIFAGKGNNGGDGFVIARLLHDMGWKVTLLLHGGKGEIHGDALVNLERIPAGVMLIDVAAEDSTGIGELLADATLAVDALLGTGLKSDVSGLYASSIARMNASDRPVVAVDIPSGVDATSGRILGMAVQAEITVTFALAKLGHVLYPGTAYTGELLVTDIGIPRELTAAAPGVEYFDIVSAAATIRRRSRVCHKGDNGHSLIVAGSTGKSGAAAMAANSAMRSGAGLVSLAVPESIHAILEIKSTEAMTIPLEDNGEGALSPAASARIMELLPGRDVVAIGPGLGTAEDTWSLVREIAAAVRVPLVMDADALNAVAGHL